jgi:hypothetical protein
VSGEAPGRKTLGSSTRRTALPLTSRNLPSPLGLTVQIPAPNGLSTPDAVKSEADPSESDERPWARHTLRVACRLPLVVFGK